MAPLTAAEIRARRLNLGLTAGQAARLFGVDPRNWRRFESGEITPRGPLVRLLLLAEKYPEVVMPVLHSLIDRQGGVGC